MRPDAENVLVICDGGLPSVVCCMLAHSPEDVVAWLPPDGSAGVDHPGAIIGPNHRSATLAQADLLGLRGVEVGQHTPWDGAGVVFNEGGGGGLPTSVMLLLASQVAARLGCTEVVWPVVCGADLDALGSATERARLVSRLVGLSPLQGKRRGDADLPIRVRTPLADLTPQQVAELALDLDAPVHTCWWWRAGSGTAGDAEEQPAWAGEARLEWEGALRDAAAARGYTDPAKLIQVG